MRDTSKIFNLDSVFTQEKSRERAFAFASRNWRRLATFSSIFIGFSFTFAGSSPRCGASVTVEDAEPEAGPDAQPEAEPDAKPDGSANANARRGRGAEAKRKREAEARRDAEETLFVFDLVETRIERTRNASASSKSSSGPCFSPASI